MTSTATAEQPATIIEPAAPQISGSECLIRSLIAAGVTDIFGYPGGAIMPVYDALYNYQKEVKHYLARHEQGAVHAAQGYARTKKTVGVVMATSGPGATNLITGIADALADSTPLVCITGQVFKHLLGTDAFQETDIISMSMPATKWNYQITDARNIARIVAKAFYIAKAGRPGPRSNLISRKMPKSKRSLSNINRILISVVINRLRCLKKWRLSGRRRISIELKNH